MTGPMQKTKLKWRCRRGMRELDELLTAYADDCYDAAEPDEKAAFEALLSLPDPEIAAYLLKKQEPEKGAISNVIQRILEHNPS